MTDTQMVGALSVRVQRLTPSAMFPCYMTPGAGAFDLYADPASFPDTSRDFVHIGEGQNLAIGTGLAFEIPPGHVMLVFGRSGMWFNSQARLGNGVGVIDSDYRGEVKVSIDVPLSGQGLTAPNLPSSSAILRMTREDVVDILQTGGLNMCLSTLSNPPFPSPPLVAPFRINSGDRIAQAIVVPYPRVSFVDCESLTPTSRGIAGFGSTGV